MKYLLKIGKTSFSIALFGSDRIVNYVHAYCYSCFCLTPFKLDPLKQVLQSTVITSVAFGHGFDCSLIFKQSPKLSYVLFGRL